MSQNKHSVVEVSGADIEKAVEAGLRQLGLKRTEVLVEVIDEGSRGLLGLGSRDAVVRVTKIGVEPIKPEPPQPPQVKKPETAVAPPPAPKPQKEAPAPKPAPKPQQPAAPVKQEVKKDVKSNREQSNQLTSEEVANETEIALSTVRELLQKMAVTADISSSLTEPDDLTGNRMIVIDIKGDDLGALIGPRGETLNSLQYVSRLMVGHKIRRRANFVVDVENYRQRREQALARLAERMASKVVKRGRPVGLEPMPSHERRIIHMTLRDNAAVYTQSTGEGNRRKVRIMPK